jgi:hypothetical protein
MRAHLDAVEARIESRRSSSTSRTAPSASSATAGAGTDSGDSVLAQASALPSLFGKGCSKPRAPVCWGAELVEDSLNALGQAFVCD